MAVGIAALVVMLLWATVVTVRQGEAVIVTRFGRPVKVHQEAGPRLKLPWPIDDALRVDLRTRVFNTGHAELLTRDRKNVLVLTFAFWKVSDPLRFYQSVGSVAGAEAKLDGLLTNAQIGVLGRYDLEALVSSKPETIRVEAIEEEILAATTEVARERYGLEIADVSFKRISLPEENVRAVFKQMQAERKQYAARYEAEGDLEATRIRSETDLAAARIRAEATSEAARIRGEAEAEAAATYSAAHAKDPELYRFLRSLETLDKVVGRQTTLVLRTDSEPFSLLQDDR